MKDTLLPFLLNHLSYNWLLDDSFERDLTQDSGPVLSIARVEEVELYVSEQTRKRTLTRPRELCNPLKESILLLPKVG
jgi:hypothetical protein